MFRSFPLFFPARYYEGGPCLDGRTVGRSDRRSVGRSVGLAGRSDWSVGRSDQSVGRPDWSVGRSVGRTGRSIGRTGRSRVVRILREKAQPSQAREASKSQAKPGKAKRPKRRARSGYQILLLEAGGFDPFLKDGSERETHPSHKPREGEKTLQENLEKEREDAPRNV